MAEVSPADVMGDLDAGVDGVAGEAPGAAHAAAEGHESIQASSSAVKDALLSTTPSTRLEDVESPFDLEAGGPPRIARGLMKMTGVEGLPAVVDLFVGVLELYLQQTTEAGGGGGSQTNDGETGPEGPVAPGFSEDYQ